MWVLLSDAREWLVGRREPGPGDAGGSVFMPGFLAAGGPAQGDPAQGGRPRETRLRCGPAQGRLAQGGPAQGGWLREARLRCGPAQGGGLRCGLAQGRLAREAGLRCGPLTSLFPSLWKPLCSGWVFVCSRLVFALSCFCLFSLLMFLMI